jgi:hypothetical protein
MRTVGPLVLLLMWLCAVVVACDKDSPPASNPVVTPPGPDGETPPPALPPSAGAAPYSGGWSGTVTVKDVKPELCSFRDKTLEVTQAWTVIGDSVHVQELIVIDRERNTYNWRGTIRNDSLAMVSKRNVLCGSSEQLLQITFKAPITASADKYNVQGYTLYTICEPNCTFEFTYQMSKAK